MKTRPIIAVLMLTLVGAYALPARAARTEVDTTDPETVQASAIEAFYNYLSTIDNEELEDAYNQVLDPGDTDGRVSVFEQLIGFMRGRQKNPISNEALVVRTSGDWAMVVYQYDTTVAGKTARVITTAWMVQWEGFWRQLIVPPTEESFWDERLSDFERLQTWFDEYAQELAEGM